jgi:hypothetical protein
MMRVAVSLIDRRKRERRDPIPAFHLFHELVEYLGRWQGLILPYESAAEHILRSLPSRSRQELKDDARIAAIALAYNSAVWTCNVTDFLKVPGLAVFRAETGVKVS